MNPEPEHEKRQTECRLPEDEQGRFDLCCCYIRQPDGSIVDPCPLPADRCC